ncbi:hypothetical protein GcC1_165013, partial [Golovinomyces cichoracearum]
SHIVTTNNTNRFPSKKRSKSPVGPTLEAEEEKWAHDIKADSASTADLESYMSTKITISVEENIMKKELWGLFQDDFQNFDGNHIRKSNTSDSTV